MGGKFTKTMERYQVRVICISGWKFWYFLLCSERVSRVLLMLADEQREVGQMEEGKIAVAVGMKNV